MNLAAPATPLPCPKGGKVFQASGKGTLWIQWTTPGPEWRRLLEIVQQLPQRKYDPALKLWTVPDTTETRAKLLSHGFQVLGGPASIGMPNLPAKRELAPWTPPWKDVTLPDLPWLDKLREYQREALQMLVWRKGSGMLALDPGLGKTATSLSFIRMNPGTISRAVVLATASTKHQWRNEAKKWGVDLPVWVLSGRKPHSLPAKGIACLNWEILPPDARAKTAEDRKWNGWLETLIAWNPDVIICDEFHLHTGDFASNRSKALVKLAKGRQFIPMSGSPMRTRPAQLFTVLHLLDPEQFANQFRYQNKYCGPRYGFGGRMVYDGASNVEELHSKFRDLGIRYTKEEVLKDLPDRIYNPVLMECTVSDAYREAQERLLSLQGVQVGLLKERLQALTASAFTEKQDAVLEWLTEFLESGKKLVLFCWHVAVADFLEAHLGNQCVRANRKDREAVVQRFVKDPSCKVILGNISALGTGVDGLQEVCSDVAFAECCWSPSDMDQASSRLHRSGQKGCVTVHFLIAQGTIDEVQLEALDTRGNSLGMIVDGKPLAEEERVLALLNSMKKEPK